MSHHSQDNPEQQLDRKTLMHSKLLAQFVLSSSTCQVVLHLLPPSFANADVSHSVFFVLFFSGVTARCVRMSNRHVLISSVPGFHRHISCTSLNSSSFPLFDSLCLGDSVFARIHPCFSRQSSLNDRSDSLSGICHYVALSLFHAMRAPHSLDSLQCVRELQCPQTRRRIFRVQPLALFQPQSLAMGVPLLLCQL